MRLRGLLAVAVFSIAMEASALAADLPILRGSYSNEIVTPGYVRWDGFTAGIQGGYSSMNSNFGAATSDLIAFILRNSDLENQDHVSQLTTLPSKSANGTQYGLFFGYNMQWSELVVGFDGAYNYVQALAPTATDSIARLFATTNPNVQHDVRVDAQASLKLKDYVTARMRAGYAIDQFLPYAMIGAAVGRFNFSTTVTVTDNQNPGGPFGPVTETESKTDSFAPGALAGVGVDVALTPDLFLRGEWEYIAFAPVHGILTSLNTGRVALGAHF